MPTTKPRHAITENEQVSAALAVAAQRWPADQDRPTRLLLRLIEDGVAPSSPACTSISSTGASRSVSPAAS